MRHAEFRHRRLVEVYDAECRWGADDDVFLAIVNETTRARVLDLGCGTGRLTLAMASAGHTVTGVDPAEASLDAARAKPGADAVTWIDGTSSMLPAAAFDVAVMTSHVAQLLVTDDEWTATFGDLREALVSGGRVVFDTRDPLARGWEQWNPVDSARRITLLDGSVVSAWTEVMAIDGPTVSFTHHFTFPDGLELESTASLRFRPEEEVRSSLIAAGFSIESIHGGWSREAVGEGCGELLVVAHT